MVTLKLCSMNETGEERQFSLIACDLETVLELGNSLINSSKDYSQAYLIEKNKSMKLPLSLFDGKPFKEPITQLKQDWEYLLTESSLDELAKKRLIIITDLLKKRINHCNKQIAIIELRIVRLELKATELQSHEGQRTTLSSLFDRYGHLIKQNRQRLIELHNRMKELVDQLNVL